MKGFRSQTFDDMDGRKAEMQKKETRSQRRKSQKKEYPDARQDTNIAQHCVFPRMRGSRGSESRRPKAADAAPADQMRNECMPLGHEAHSQVKKLRTARFQTLLEAAMLERCTPLGRAAHLQGKKLKTPPTGALLAVETSKTGTPSHGEVRLEVTIPKASQVCGTFGS